MSNKTHQTCPKCGANDAYTEFTNREPTDRRLGYCHSQCGTVLGDKVDLKGVKHTFKGIRGLTPEVAEKYGILVMLTEEGVPVEYRFKYPSNVKIRDFYDKKNMRFRDKGPSEDLFGPAFNSGTSKRIYLTEGEFDAATLYQELGQSYPVMSFPSASASDKLFKKNLKFLDSFEEIVLATDNDGPGKKLAQKVYSIFPTKTFYVPLTKYKDPNGFIWDEKLNKPRGDGEDLKWAALKPKRFKPDNFFSGSEEFDSIIDEEIPYEFFPTGLSSLDNKIKGLTTGGLMLLKAPEGVGKTELLRFFEYQALSTTSEKIAVVHMEEQKSVTLGGLASYELGHDVKYKHQHNTSMEQVKEAYHKYTDKERFIMFEMNAEDEATDILDHIHIAITVYGCRFIFIDHVHRLIALGSQQDERKTLDTLAAKMAQKAKDHNVCICCISHVNDDGQTRSSRMLSKEAMICIDLERDLENEDEEERNTTHMTVSKNRPWASTGPAGSLLYNEGTTLLTEGLI